MRIALDRESVGSLVVAAAVLAMSAGSVMAQQYKSGGGGFGVGDIGSVVSGFRAVVGIATTVVPFIILAYYTWKKQPKDAYEASWLALGWCGLAYVLR
jgi:hypothetical protein